MVVEDRERSEARTETPASIPQTPDIEDSGKQTPSDGFIGSKTPEEDSGIQILSLNELSQIFKDGSKADKDTRASTTLKYENENQESLEKCGNQDLLVKCDNQVPFEQCDNQESLGQCDNQKLLVQCDNQDVKYNDDDSILNNGLVSSGNEVVGKDKNGNELNDAKIHLSDATRRIHEMEIEIKRLESEREELSLAYKEAETLRKQEESKAQRLSSDLATLRHESERRIAQKEEEIEALRKQMSLEIDQLSQRVAEAEAKVKTEVARIRKKMQIQITEIEMQLDVCNKQNIDLQKTVKIQSTKITELQSHYDEVHRQLQQCVDQLAVSQRRCQALSAELEEIRVTLEQTQRAKRQVEQSLEEVQARVSEITTINVNITSAKGKLENEYLALQADYEEISKELRISDERYNRTIIELKSIKDLFVEEQERTVKIESIKKSLEIEVRTLQTRIEEVEVNALAGGRRVVSKLEARIRDVEVELEEEKRRHSETQKLLRKKEHRTKELCLQTEEDHKTISMLSDSVEKLSEKVKVYKRQLNEQEGMTQQNLTRVRRYQRELEAAEDRAEQAESNLNFIRTRHRTIVTSAGPASMKQVLVTTSTTEESSSAQY